MTTYYIRTGGSDANAGTSAGAAWATIGKALGASGIASGDTVYIGPGTYREVVTVAMTSATVTTNIIGDVDGSHTGDPAGPVIWTAYTTNDLIGPSSSANVNLNGRDFLSFSSICFIAGLATAGAIDGGTATPINITLTDCTFIGSPTTLTLVAHTTAANTASNWTIDRCIFWSGPKNSAAGTIALTVTRHVADYNTNITIRNCQFNGGPQCAVRIASTGAGSGFGGGIAVRSCTLWGGVAFGVQAADANLSVSQPISVTDCIIMSPTGLSAVTVGQIVEDYNAFVGCTTARSGGVVAGSHSTTTYAPTVHVGQEMQVGQVLRPWLMPMIDSPLSAFGDDGSLPSVDIFNRLRSASLGRIITSGTFTSGATATATDTGAAFGSSGQLNGMTVKITGGTGSGQTMMIRSHTKTVLTGYGNWNTVPDNTSTYVIYSGNPSFTGKATSGGPSSLTQSNAAWDTNLWQRFVVEITGGTGTGQINFIGSNSSTALNTSTAWTTQPDSTSTFVIYRQTSVNAPVSAVGASTRHDSARKETILTDAGGIAWALYSVSDQDLIIPVDTSSTVITIKCSFDTAHGNTNKPYAEIMADGELGIVGETKVCTGTAGSGTFETLIFSPQVPLSKGAIRLRLHSRAANLTGRAVFDSVMVV